MNCRTTSADKCRTRLGFKQYDVILTKEQSVLTKIMTLFDGENIETQYNVLSYRIDLYCYDYKLAIEIDENEHSDRNIDDKIKYKKQYNKNLVVSLLEWILTKKTVIFLELSMKYLHTLNNRLKRL